MAHAFVAMIPYIEWKTIQIGPVTIYVWGLFVALGALLAVWLARRAARRDGILLETERAATWLLFAGFLGGRLGHALFYEPARFLADPVEIFRIWHGGFSSIGGFLGALVALAVFLRRTRVDALLLTDALARGFPLGWAVGRIGCFLIHDHPGTLSDAFYAVAYPGGSRIDLGLVDAVTALLVAADVFLLSRVIRQRGIATLALAIGYLPLRFLADFLRATDLPGSDVRYGGLTPAQIGILVLLPFAVWWTLREMRKRPT